MKKLSALELIKNYGIIIVLVFLVVLFTALKPNFINIGNLLEILRQISITGIIAVGMTFCLLAGQIDLTVGSNAALGMMVCAIWMVNMPIKTEWLGGFNINPIIGAILGIITTTLVGLLNGFLINKLRITSLIVTLAMMEIIRGFVYVNTSARPIFEGFTDYFRFLGQGQIFNIIPVPAIVTAIVFIVGFIILNRTVMGRYVYAVGGNSEVSRLSGINVRKMKYIVFGISGFLSGVAGIVLLSRTNSFQPRAGLGYEFAVLTACVLGGISISGGEGKLTGVLFGTLIMGVLFNGLIQVGLSEFYQMIIKGAVLIGAVALDSMFQLRKAKISVVREDLLITSIGEKVSSDDN
jgi:ribose transport system permease protein